MQLTEAQATDAFLTSSFLILELEQPKDQVIALAVCAHYAGTQKIASVAEWTQAMGLDFGPQRDANNEIVWSDKMEWPPRSMVEGIVHRWSEIQSA